MFKVMKRGVLRWLRALVCTSIGGGRWTGGCAIAMPVRSANYAVIAVVTGDRDNVAMVRTIRGWRQRYKASGRIAAGVGT